MFFTKINFYELIIIEGFRKYESRKEISSLPLMYVKSKNHSLSSIRLEMDWNIFNYISEGLFLPHENRIRVIKLTTCTNWPPCEVNPSDICNVLNISLKNLNNNHFTV